MKNRINKVIKLMSVLLISLVVFSSVYAQNVKLKDVKITDKNIEIEDPVISGNEITNEINLNEVGNFVTYEITIQNNDSYDYTIDSIEDNNKNKNISLSYIYSKENIKKNGEYKFKVTVLYKNRLENIEEINLKDTKITINLIREDGKESSIVVNPTTGDSILKYFLLLILVLVGVILKQKKKVFYKVLFIIPILLLPLVIFANESFKQDVIFKSINVKGVMLPYEVTINVPGEDPIIKTVIYGDEIGELPDVNVDGYEFNGWEDDKGNTVDEHTKVTGKIEVTPKLSPIIYTITYDLQGGTATGNKETYTVETDTFTLVNPSKRGYSFSGWTGSNGEALQTEVTVYKGTTGNLNYKAHYKQTENIPYKVIHRKQKLTLDGYDIEEEQIEHGSAGTTVRPQTREYEGFISPEEQDLIITDDGLASITYDYNRVIYSYVVDTNTNSTIPSGDYPYGTEATITANNVPGYTFEKWSDDETNNPRDIIVSEGTTNIKPVYKANEDTAYTVIHYQMDIDGIHYTEYERENKTGTTGEEVTPLPKTYTGFTSPSPKTDTIKGDGTTIVEYYYSRNDITITIDIPGEDPITKTVKYDDVIGELPTPSKDGYTFDGYEDGDRNPVDENTKVHGEMTITPVFSAIEYTISYDLNGGLNHSENPDKYTIESNNITLKDASRNGYTFIGWTGSNGTTPQKNVVIEKGTTGNKNYKANFSKSADTLDITLDVVSYPYDGNPKTPEVTIKDGDVVLVEGRDYTVEYSDNINAGTATVKVTMTGSVNPDTGASYEGEKEVHFEITAVPPVVELINTSKTYTGEPIVFTSSDVSVTPDSGGEISFKYCTDTNCEHEVSSIEDAGTYYVIAHVSANGNYSQSDSEPTEITIERKSINVPEVTTTFTYTGLDQELLTNTTEYTVSNNIGKNAGTYDVQVTPTGNYKWSDGTTTPKTVTVTINPYDINNGSVVPMETYTYDGTAKEPTPSVIVPLPTTTETTILTSSDLDYTYENNINAGEAEVIITGKGNYTGTITKTFEIEKADGSIELSRTSDNIIYGTDSITVDVLNSTGEIEANTTTSGVQVSVNENTITITGLSSIDSGETVEVKVKAKTSTNYKEAEETYSITVSDAAITGGSVTITGVNGVGETLTAVVEDTTPVGTYTYEWYRNDEDSMTGGTMIDGETNNTYTLTNDDIGKYIYVVVTASKQNYTPITFKDKIDAENNKTDKTKIEVEIPVSTNTCKNLTYNGDTQILTNESGEGYAYINNSGENAGEYTVEARLEENYMWSDYTFNNKPVTCVINKKNITIKADNQTKVYDGTSLNADTTCTDVNRDLINGHLPVCTSSGTIINVGNETKVLNTVIIKQNETDLTNNYNITKENGDLSVTTRDITCTSSSNTKVYDGTPLTDNTGTCTNLVANQTAAFTNTGSVTNVSDTSEGNNTLDSVLITTQDSTDVTTNYNIAKHNGTLTITRANSTCEITNNPVIYYPGDNTATINYTCTGDGTLSISSSTNVITVSNQTATSSTLSSTNTGTATITVSKAEGPNYNSTSVTKDIAVNASIYHVIFDKNDEAATGVMEPQDMTYGVATALNENQYSKSGYVFVGWNTEPDGTGTAYTDKQEVTSLAESGNVTLYAEWIEAQATFDTGVSVNLKMKRLAGQSSDNYTSENTNITLIQKSSVKPDISTMTSNNIVSTNNSNVPIYMWFDNGTIYWWSEDNNPSLNSNSSYFFNNLKSLTDLDISLFDTSHATNMFYMFDNCRSLTNLDLGGNFDTSNVTNMSSMFSECSSLTSLDLGDNFDTSNVTNMSGMFSGCSSLTSLELGENFDTSNVIGMAAMFSECSSLTSLELGNKFDTSNVTDMGQIFNMCTGLTSLDLGNKFDTSNVTNMYMMFHNCGSLTSLDLGNKFDTSNVTDMSSMFDGCYTLTTLNLGDKFDTSNVTTMIGMFWGLKNLTNLDLGDKFDTSNVTNMISMFNNCSNLTSLDLGDNFDTSNVTKMNSMFFGCSGLTTINLGNKFNTLKVANMEYMFSGCSSLTSLDLGNKFDTSNVTTMGYMFSGCSSLTTLDLGDKFNTSNVATMGSMFSGCSSLTTLDLGDKFNTSNVTNMQSMFRSCDNIKTIFVTNSFVTSSVTASNGMFAYDYGLIGGMGTIYNSTKIDKEYAHIDGGTSNPGYFTDKSSINIRFDANGGEGTMNDQVVQYDVATPLNANTFTKSGYLFVGWNTKADGTGTAYEDGANIQAKSVTTLYAQWIVAQAMFDTGQNVNAKMKKLAGSGASAYSTDTNVTSLQKSLAKPDISQMTSDNIVSISNSTYNTPIYMWYDNGTIYWWSEDSKPSINSNGALMFGYFGGLTSLSFTDFDLSTLTNADAMFYRCTNLASIDFSSVDTRNLENMESMFSNCSSLTSLNLTSFNTSKVTNMEGMFSECTSLSSIDLSSFNTSKVTNMYAMFNHCTSLTSLDLTSFNTNRVTNMQQTFDNCTNLTTIYTSSLFDTSNVASSSYMFNNDSKLVGGLGTKYDSNHIDKAYAHFDGGVSDPGYFTSKTGWRFVNSTTSQSLTDQQWSYFENGVRIESGWHMLDDLYGQEQKYYFVNGIAHLGWLEYEGDRYYLSTEDDDGNGYVNAGAYRSTIKEINNKYYRFDSEGRCSNYDQDLYLIEFNANGGTASEESRYVDQGNELGTLPTATRTNYIFNGWWTDLTGGVEVTSSTVPTSSTTYFARWAEINTIEFNSNGGEFSDSSTTNTIKYYDPDYYDDTVYKEPTKSGHVFVGWNEEPDGSETTTYQNEQDILTNSIILNGKTLYAQWIEAQAMFDTGQNVNVKMKKLAGNASATYSTEDTNITSIQKSSTKPDISSMTIDNIVSMSNTIYNTPIYMWYDNGTIYWWSEDSEPSLNSNSSNMFYNFTNVTSIDISSFDATTAIDMHYMFYECNNLTNLNMGDNFNTQNVTYFYYMFYNCRSLVTLDLGNINTSNATNMEHMFYDCRNLTNLELGNRFNASKVTNMYQMFENCSNIQELDLSQLFRTGHSHSVSMYQMFYNCYSLKKINISNWDFSNATFIRFFGSDNSTTSYRIPVETIIANNVTLGDGAFNGSSSGLFYNLTKLKSLSLKNVNTENVTNLGDGFYGCKSLTSLDLSSFNSSNVKNLESLFKNCESLVDLNVSNWDISSVTNASYVFENCINLTTIDLSGWNTSSMTNMYHMFYGCSNLTTIYATSSFVTTSVTSSSDMFTGDTKLVGGMGTVFDSSHIDKAYAHIDGGTSNPGYFTDKTNISIKFDANGGEGTMNDQVVQYDVATPLNTNTFTKSGYVFVGWNTKADGTGTAYADGANIQAKSLTTLYAQWIEAQAMFDTGKNVNAKMKKLAGNSSATYTSEDSNITSIQKSSTKPDISSMTNDNIVSISNTTYNTPIYMWYDNGTIYWWSEDGNPSLNQDSSYIFYNLQGLTSIDLTNFDTSNVTDMSGLFSYCNSLTTLNLGSNFNTSKVTNMSHMFNKCSRLTSLDVNNFDTSNVTNMYMMFSYCSSLTSLDVSNFNTSNVTNMYMMFSYCSSLISLDVSNFNTSKVTNMSSMFNKCSSLSTLDLGDKFNTSNVTNMRSMFISCQDLTHLYLGDKFDTSNVTDMGLMFNDCKNLITLNLGNNFETSKVTDMSWMFLNCSSLISLDLGNKFNTSNVTKMTYMFRGMSSLITIYATSIFDTSSLTNSDGMFTGDTNLVGGMGTTYSSSHIDAAYAHIDGGTSNPGYFTDKSTISIKFDANGGEGTMNDQVVQYDVATPLNTNTFTKSGFVFDGWNTKTDGTGTAYVDGANIQAKSLTTLYAQWTQLEAMFDTGGNVNVKMKKLAGNPSALITTSDTNITSIQKSSTKPDISSMTSDNIVSISNATYNTPIYMWYDNGTIYWWSEDNNPSLNQHSSHMYRNLNELTNIDLTHFDTSKVDSMEFMFGGCSNITSLDLSNFDTSNVTSMWGMFGGCSNIISLDLSNFDTGNVTSMSYIFQNCTNLTNLNLKGKFNTTNVTKMQAMFDGCVKITTLDLSNFCTSKVTDMMDMFSDTGLISLDLSMFDTSNVTSMSMMFFNSRNLKVIDLSSFDTSKVTGMSYMFKYCSSLITIYVSDKFSTLNLSSHTQMFYGCNSIKGGSGTTFNYSHIDGSYARIDGGTSNPGYFTYKASPTGGNISRFINAFKPKNLLTNKFILLGEVLAIITIGSITFVIMHKQRKKIK